MAATDTFAGLSSGLSTTCDDGEVITKSNTVDFTKVSKAIYVGGAGDVTVVTKAGNVLLFTAVPAGTTIWIRASRVNSTGTSATLMVALY